MLIDPQHITLSALESIYRGAAAELIPGCKASVDKSANVVARAAAEALPIYGINTGFGKLASVRISPDDALTLQRNLIRSHCAGVGDPLPANVVRLVIVLKMISLGRGASGVRWELIRMLSGMLQAGILPVIPSQGICRRLRRSRAAGSSGRSNDWRRGRGVPRKGRCEQPGHCTRRDCRL